MINLLCGIFQSKKKEEVMERLNDFETERCIIRSFREEDLDSVIEYRNNEEWMKYQGFKGKTKEEYRRSLIVPFDLMGTQLAIVSKEITGLIGDLYVSKEEDVINVGYTINPAFSRRGYAFEVMSSFVSLINELHSDCIIKAETDLENIPSRNLLVKLGFELVLESREGVVFEHNILK